MRMWKTRLNKVYDAVFGYIPQQDYISNISSVRMELDILKAQVASLAETLGYALKYISTQPAQWKWEPNNALHRRHMNLLPRR